METQKAMRDFVKHVMENGTILEINTHRDINKFGSVDSSPVPQELTITLRILTIPK